MADPGDEDIEQGEVRERITLDIPASDFAFLKQWALYKNALAKVSLEKQSGNKSLPARSRKSLAEISLHSRLIEKRSKFKEMFDEVGEFPPVSSKKVTPDERKAMIAYVKRVLAWEEKRKK